MTIQEFSNSFDTMLNSYNSQPQFGEQANRGDIVLDEYEKSVLLTQAQDIVVKSYFDRNNNLGQGIDDSSRRQMDFSSLITVNKLLPLPPIVTIYVTGTHSGTTETIISSSGLTFQAASSNEAIRLDRIIPNKYTLITSDGGTTYTISNLKHIDDNGVIQTEELTVINGLGIYLGTSLAISFSKQDTYDDRGQLYQLPSKSLFVLNESIKGASSGQVKNYIVVPIHYKEYDRQMSKAFTQPLKKQCWRLFQDTGSETLTELIPISGVFIMSYTMRYVRRPRPIILTNLDNGYDSLNIDGISVATECELNPIVHMDILNKAVELAISTRTHSLQEPNNK